MTISAASFLTLLSARYSPPEYGLPRSNSSRYLAHVQPSFKLPTRFSFGTLTSSKNTWLISCAPSAGPSSVTNGDTVTPGVCISISRNEMPSCRLPSFEVRTRQKIISACCAIVVQIFVPLQRKWSPLSSAFICSDAKSEPEPGSE